MRPRVADTAPDSGTTVPTLSVVRKPGSCQRVLQAYRYRSPPISAIASELPTVPGSRPLKPGHKDDTVAVLHLEAHR